LIPFFCFLCHFNETSLKKIGQMTVLSTGSDGAGASKIPGDVLNVAAQSLAMVKGLTGIDIGEALRRDRKKNSTPLMVALLLRKMGFLTNKGARTSCPPIIPALRGSSVGFVLTM
jgi:hypothetical protein